MSLERSPGWGSRAFVAAAIAFVMLRGETFLPRHNFDRRNKILKLLRMRRVISIVRRRTASGALVGNRHLGGIQQANHDAFASHRGASHCRPPSCRELGEAGSSQYGGPPHSSAYVGMSGDE